MPVHNVAAGTVREVMPEDMVLAQGEMGAVTRAVSSTEDAERLNWYLRAILTANVYDVAVESALDYAPRLSERVGAKIHLKREDLQPVKSFKLRGAYNRMAAISPEAREKGVAAQLFRRQRHAGGRAAEACLLHQRLHRLPRGRRERRRGGPGARRGRQPPFGRGARSLARGSPGREARHRHAEARHVRRHPLRARSLAREPPIEEPR